MEGEKEEEKCEKVAYFLFKYFLLDYLEIKSPSYKEFLPFLNDGKSYLSPRHRLLYKYRKILHNIESSNLFEWEKFKLHRFSHFTECFFSFDGQLDVKNISN